MEFSYRRSGIQVPQGPVVLSAVFRLESADPDTVKARMKDLMGRRSASQPLDLPSAGSAFKRPASGYAAALIDETGLRGFRVGSAGISQKQTGFAVTLGGATAEDMKARLRQVSQKVFDRTAVRLEPEIRIWDENGICISETIR